jgi:hypothetical protein
MAVVLAILMVARTTGQAPGPVTSFLMGLFLALAVPVAIEVFYWLRRHAAREGATSTVRKLSYRKCSSPLPRRRITFDKHGNVIRDELLSKDRE